MKKAILHPSLFFIRRGWGWVGLLLLFSCHRPPEPVQENAFAPRIIPAHGHVIPADSVAPPIIAPVDEKAMLKVPVEKLTKVPGYTNVCIAGAPHVVPAGAPRVCTPGQDTFSLPKVLPAISKPFLPGAPQVTTLPRPTTKEHNPQNFSTVYSSGTTPALLQDKSGNLWISTWSGGVTKFDGKNLTSFTKKEGLVDNSIFSMMEDKSGNIWFGGAKGVTKYDGKTFTNFSKNEGLSDQRIYSMGEDKSGNIWFAAAHEGAIKFDGRSFTHFTEKEGLVDNSVTSVLEDKSGKLWFGTDNGASQWDGHSFRNFTVKEGLPSVGLKTIMQDKTGNLWFGTSGGGLVKYDGQSFTNYTEKEGLVNNSINTITEDKDANLWLGTFIGISKFDGKTFSNFTEKEGLGDNFIWSSLEDKSGNLWFSTHAGVIKYNGRSFTHLSDKEGLSTNYVLNILEDKSGDLWFTTGGGGISKWNGRYFLNDTIIVGTSAAVINSIAEDGAGNKWFGFMGGVFKYDGKAYTFFMDPEIIGGGGARCLEDRNGNMWFATYGNGVTKYDGKTFTHYTEKQGLCSNIVRWVIEDKKGNLWFGTETGGVSKWNGKNFTNFTQKEGLSDNFIWTIFEDKSGNIWFGTNDGGAVEYDGRSFTVFTDKEGLLSNGVTSILQDKSGNLWFGTTGGLSKLSPGKLAAISDSTGAGTHPAGNMLFKNYTNEDGFPGCDFNALGIDRTGTIWIGKQDGVIAYHPEGDIPDTIPPNVQLTGVRLYNENIAWQNLLATGVANGSLAPVKDTTILLGNGVRLSNFKFDSTSPWYGLPANLSLAYNNNYLTFNFIGITLKDPKKVKYKYKLAGLDENWSALTSDNEAHYGNLPNGYYTFIVKALNGEGYWSNEFHYTFTIRPPWWKTWWFRGLAALAIFSSAIFYIRWRERALKERQKVLEKTVKVRTAELEKQKDRSESLLLNILPAEVAEELKEKGRADAKLFDDVTVLFTDFKGFTNVSERLTPQQLVDELDACFSAFDKIIAKYDIEKIKTVGDAYMAVAGLPVPNPNHAEDVVKAALEIRNFMLDRKLKTQNSAHETFEVRIGVHSGSVVAGIVGVKKFAYDIWGDTVNTAARMEQNGEAGKVNISEATYELVKDKFTCEYRGEIEAKNKGKLKMYFVE